MSEDCGYDADWFRKYDASSLERKKRLTVKEALAEPGDSFLIVTEGTVTEPVYFDLVVKDLQLSVVRVRVQPGVASDPRHVIRTASKEAKKQIQEYKQGRLGIGQPAKFDQVWAVVDTDVAVRMGFWSEVLQLAAAKKVKLAHSTPCIEFWLLLHIVGFTTRADLINGKAAKKAIKDAFGEEYATNETVAKEAIAKFYTKWPEAVGHAENVRRHHVNAETKPPGNPSTEVDRLIRALNDSAPSHLRKSLP